MSCPPISHRTLRRTSERGYVLLTLLLVVSLMVIAAAAILPSISFELKRDREQEMIHRGVQYSRAIRGYYKKFGRYPTRLEDLDNTNNLRYLRKRYKDPLNKDHEFRLLHFGDPDLKLGGSIGGGVIPGAAPAGSPSGAFGSSSSAFGGSPPGASNLGGSNFGGSNFGASGAAGSQPNSGVNNSGIFAQPSASGGNPNGSPSSDSKSPGTDPSAAGSASDPSQAPTSPSTQTAPQAGGEKNAFSFGAQPGIGGGPIVGVASLSKKDTIREFNKKKKYNEWQFIYDPTADRGGLISTPYQPALQGMAQAGQNGQPGQPAANGNTFGQTPGLFNNPTNNPNAGGAVTPIQPPSNPPPQQ